MGYTTAAFAPLFNVTGKMLHLECPAQHYDWGKRGSLSTVRFCMVSPLRLMFLFARPGVAEREATFLTWRFYSCFVEALFLWIYGLLE